MRLDEIQDNANTIAKNLRYCIIDGGYTLSSFCYRFNFDRKEIESLLKGDIDINILAAVLFVFDLTVEELLDYEPKPPIKISKQIILENISEQNYELLLNILNLSNIEYREGDYYE